MQALVSNSQREAQERTMRSIFVGNIPYEATEDKLKEMFEQAGPVLSFRLVYDRESGKPKGYGFCEYKDLPTAQAALRNLHNIEYNGRPLRVGPAAGEQNNQDMVLPPGGITGPPLDTPYGEKVDPKTAPEEISKAVASLPPEQMYELMKQMKLCIQNNPNEARNMLLQNPQLAYALLQAQIVMKIVDPKVAIAMLNRSNEQIPPVMPTEVAPAPAPAPPPMGPRFMGAGVPTSNFSAPTSSVRQAPPVSSWSQNAPPMNANKPPPGPVRPPNTGYPPTGVNAPPMMRPMQQPQQPTGGGLPPRALPPSQTLSMGALAGGDQEKAALIMQVLQLSDEQISMLPEDQRRSIMILKEQLAKAGQL